MVDFNLSGNSEIQDKLLYKRDKYVRMTMINRYGLPDYYQNYDGVRGFIFFTRPDLNIFGSDGNVLPKVLANCPHIAYLAGTSWGINILKSLTDKANDICRCGNILPILSNSVRGYTPQDERVEINEYGTTWHGSRMVYAEETIKTRSAVQVSFPAKDDKDQTLYHTLAVIQEYIEKVKLGLIVPKEKYSIGGVLDYTMTATFILTDLTATNIVFWEQLSTGIVLNVPKQPFTWQVGQAGSSEVVVEFAFAFRPRSMNISDLADLNTHAQIGINEHEPVITNYTSLQNTYVGAPIVLAHPTIKGKYVLKWRTA